jgi:hypothetical protein
MFGLKDDEKQLYKIKQILTNEEFMKACNRRYEINYMCKLAL